MPIREDKREEFEKLKQGVMPEDLQTLIPDGADAQEEAVKTAGIISQLLASADHVILAENALPAAALDKAILEMADVGKKSEPQNPKKNFMESQSDLSWPAALRNNQKDDVFKLKCAKLCQMYWDRPVEAATLVMVYTSNTFSIFGDMRKLIELPKKDNTESLKKRDQGLQNN